jgi:hypothetical protein
MTYEDTILLTPTSPMARALSIAGGLQTNSASDLGELDTQAPTGIDLVDAVRLARRAAGLE